MNRGSLTLFRSAFSIAFAGRVAEVRLRPLWLGAGFTKTQYAGRFVPAHETLCHILDITRDEGILIEADDSCGFYEHRDWSKSAEIVNEASVVAWAMSQMTAAAAKRFGGKIQILSLPGLNTCNLINVKPEKKAEESPER